MATALLWLTCGEFALAGDGGTWSAGSSMEKSRSYHTATLLLNGKVLVTGGFEPASIYTRAVNTDHTELYDPATGNSSCAGVLRHYRSGHTATLLPDGRVLVAGGFADRETLADAEIYDPSCSKLTKHCSPSPAGGATCIPWTKTGSMNTARAGHTATLLRDGRVLVVGGVALSSSPNPQPEVYNPATGKWSKAAALEEGIRAFHTATLLQNGQVLVLGGGQLALGGAGFTELEVRLYGEPFFSLPFSIHAKALNSAWLYDPTADRWNSLGAQLKDARAGHTATLMPDGRVLVVGGWNPQNETSKATLELAGMTTDGGMTLSSSELYDPVTQRFEPAGSESSGRAGHTATLLSDGRVLVTGGSFGETILNTTSVYNPNLSEANRWSPAKPLPESRSLHTATLIPGGRVLVAGGYKKDTDGTRVTFKFILYDANTGAWSSAESMLEPRSDFTSTLLPDGKVLVAGGRGQTADSGPPLRSAELYTSSYGNAGSTAPVSPLRIARHGHSATLLPNGKVLVAGGFSSDGKHQPLRSTEVYDPAASSWSLSQTEMQYLRGAHTATLLPTGRVLMVSGRGIAGSDGFSEEYDITTDAWDRSSSRDIGAQCEHHTATLLLDGSVLVAGGRTEHTFNSISLLYDPFTRSWTSTENKLAESRYSHTATLLLDGKVLVAGGYSDTRPLDVAELYDPSDKRWIRSSNKMLTERALHAAVLLPSGQVLVTGGMDKNGTPLASAELYDPTTDSWSAAPSLTHARASHAMAALPDGNILVLGGTGSMGVLSSAELYSIPRSGPFEPPLISEVEPFNDWSQKSFEPGMALTVTGERFRSGSEASGGGTNSSAVNFPLLRLRSFETGQWITPQGQKWVPPPGEDSAPPVTMTLPPLLPDGHYLLSVTSSGQSTSKVILLRNLAPPDTFFTSPSELSSEEPAASVSFRFSSNDADVHSYECSLDGAGFTPCTSPHSVANLDFTLRTFRVRARDLANNVDDTPAEHTWSRSKLSHYGWGCSAGGGALWLAGPWTLLLLGLRRCRRPR